jgi:hypothetical protein
MLMSDDNHHQKTLHAQKNKIVFSIWLLQQLVMLFIIIITTIIITFL